jgi:hypothetical protein
MLLLRTYSTHGEHSGLRSCTGQRAQRAARSRGRELLFAGTVLACILFNIQYRFVYKVAFLYRSVPHPLDFLSENSEPSLHDEGIGFGR